MDFQKMLDALNDIGKMTRSSYHITLGEAIGFLSTADADYAVTVDYDEMLSVDRPHSYRGYYSDLAIEPSGTIANASDVLSMLKVVRGKTLHGYKGGEFLMDDGVPLWVAEYSCLGRAITGIHVEGRGIVLDTKEVD